CKRVLLAIFLELARGSAAAGKAINFAFAQVNVGVIGIAQARGRREQSVQKWPKIESRAADDLEHVGGGGLLLQGFAQFIQQSNVLNRDVRRVCEIDHE